jgi:hypothetical protein
LEGFIAEVNAKRIERFLEKRSLCHGGISSNPNSRRAKPLCFGLEHEASE